MHPEFIKWLSEQRYRYYLGDCYCYYAAKKDGLWSWYEITHNDYR